MRGPGGLGLPASLPAAPLPAATVLAAMVLGAMVPSTAWAADPTAAPTRGGAAFVDWSGPYLGLQGSAGASFGTLSLGPTTVGGRAIPDLRSGDATGRSDRGRDATTAVGGVFGGWNRQTGPWLYGIEADVSGANLKRPLARTRRASASRRRTRPST